jgi:hypothetical protein
MDQPLTTHLESTDEPVERIVQRHVFGRRGQGVDSSDV